MGLALTHCLGHFAHPLSDLFQPYTFLGQCPCHLKPDSPVGRSPPPLGARRGLSVGTVGLPPHLAHSVWAHASSLGS